MGYAVGAVLSGVLADWLGVGAAITAVGFLVSVTLPFRKTISSAYSCVSFGPCAELCDERFRLL